MRLSLLSACLLLFALTPLCSQTPSPETPPPPKPDPIGVARAKAKALLFLSTPREVKTAPEAAVEVLPEPKDDRAKPTLDYTGALNQSMATGKALVVVVGLDRPELLTHKNFIGVNMEAFPGMKGRGIVVSVDGLWVDTLPATATDGQIQEAVIRAKARQSTSLRFVARSSVSC